MPSDDLIGSWDLNENGRDGSGQGNDAIAHGSIAFGRSSDPAMPRSVARIDSGRGHLEVPRLRGFDGSDFTVELSVNACARPTSALGDLVSLFDGQDRRGFTLGFQHGAVCGSHGNDRNLFFGIDQGMEPAWVDYGSPCEAAVMIYALAVHDGSLYAATWEEAPSDLGHVYRLENGVWQDVGAPWNANAVTRLAVHEGHLYAGTSRVRGGGSARPDSANHNPGGRILRYEGGQEWSDQGQLDGADSVGGLVPFDGVLYATPFYSQGVFRMEAPGRWAWCGTPGRRLLALGVHDGALYGAGNDHVDVDAAMRLTAAGIVIPAESEVGGGGVFRYDGDDTWVSCGLQPDTTQIYSIQTHDGRMYISTWPSGLVFRQTDRGGWQSVGRLGDETEVMALSSYNGMLYGGTLPHAEVYRFDREGNWARLRALDTTPDVLYRRAHAMCVFDGALYCGTLPAGAVHSMTAGRAVSHDWALAPGWHHVAGVKTSEKLELYVDGRVVASNVGDALPPFGSEPTGPMRLGGGPHANLDGELADVRLYGRALTSAEVTGLATAASSRAAWGSSQ